MCFAVKKNKATKKAAFFNKRGFKSYIYLCSIGDILL